MQFQVFDNARDHGATLHADAERARLAAEARVFGRRTVGAGRVDGGPRLAGSLVSVAFRSAAGGAARALATATALAASIGRRSDRPVAERQASGHGADCAG